MSSVCVPVSTAAVTRCALFGDRKVAHLTQGLWSRLEAPLQGNHHPLSCHKLPDGQLFFLRWLGIVAQVTRGGFFLLLGTVKFSEFQVPIGICCVIRSLALLGVL